MLEKLQKVALIIRPLSVPALIGVPVFSVLFVMNIFEVQPVSNPDYLIPIVIGLLWSIFLYSFVGSFQEIPEPPQPNHKFFSRVKARFARVLYWLLALITVFTSVGVVVISVRLLGAL